MTDKKILHRKEIPRIRWGIMTCFLGLFLFVLGAEPGWFGLDRSEVVGFVQIAVFLIGLAIICFGGYFSLLTLWERHEKSILADIGVRLVSSGYVLAAVAGLADVFGFGSEPWPHVPVFGALQLKGVLFGEVIIAVGFLLLIPIRQHQK